MDKFDRLIENLKQSSINKSEKGTKFEEFIKRFLMTAPLYKELYESVWLWTEFPYNGGKHDYGIDLVAKRRDIDEYYAIQCKFYSENTYIDKADVDTFLSASGKPFFIEGKPIRYTGRIIVSTSDKWTSTAEDIIEGQIPAVSRIRLQDLKESGIDWDTFNIDNASSMKCKERKKLRPHQTEAVKDVIEGFKQADRGKLIMACGTGKTFTSLKIVEEYTQGSGNVLFLVPSISLLNQTLQEWTTECKYPFQIYAICSDAKASKVNRDSSESLTDLIIPATTNVDVLVDEYTNIYNLVERKGLRLFFSTYQSIDVVSRFQKITGMVFDITVCDEAHRTTGVTLAGEDESDFVKVHDNDYINTKKRLYMTATPRIYGEESKRKAEEGSAVLCSMDDTAVYGEVFHSLGFGDSVSQGLLSDYKVIVLAVDEGYVSKALQNLLTDKDSELTLDDSVKIIGCLNGLSKRTLYPEEENYFENDPQKMKRAVAFCSDIKSSKRFVQLFGEIQDTLKKYGYDESLANVELSHVDGTQNALYRKEKIDWLKESTPENNCRVLSNARCLSEGIDVPALDAVMFLNPRNSIVDIIQSVGRVMRKSEGKNFGYIILPIGIPAGMEPEEALSDNKKYKIVWDVLQALRAHDDRFNNTINKIELNKKKPGSIQVIGVAGKGDGETPTGNKNGETVYQLTLPFEDLQKWKESIFAKIVKKCGSRKYWETWAKDIADIANRHINEIEQLISNPQIKDKFEEFLSGLQSNLNSSIDKDAAIEMLAEHMITKPVFDALFEDYEFIKSNPVSIIMQDMLNILDEKALDKEQEVLDKFYLSVRERAKGIDNAEGKQKIVIELYEQFFKNALPKQVAKLGIVYTPIQVVDFIIKSVEYVLNTRFDSSMNNKDVHVLDPFTGTGTFIVQLIRSGIIKKEDLIYKYCNEIHANEIVLLAYYIAAVNIEETFHDLMESDTYTPFEGIVLTDTFELSESVRTEGGAHSAEAAKWFGKNSERANKQLEAPITVIIGNPPYSSGQKSGNDNNQNIPYPILDNAVANTYVAKSKAVLKKGSYDTCIRAFRWATDRLEDNGIIGFVTNGSFIDGKALDGFRASLLEEFNYIYCFNLRGNARTSGEQRRKEAGNVFDSGSRTSVAITILVKKKGAKKDGYLRYYDIGDYLTREQKLNIIRDFGSIEKIQWKVLRPDDKNDWINQRNPEFMNFVVLGEKNRLEKISVFSNNYATGIKTNRDAWVYNFSKEQLRKNVSSMIDFYNSERVRCFDDAKKNKIVDKKQLSIYLQNIRNNDEKKISWSDGLFRLFINQTRIEYKEKERIVSYRPFCKRYIAYDKDIIERMSIWDSIFPTEDKENIVICISGTSTKKGFSALITNTIQDFQYMFNAQSFPLYYYEKEEDDKQQITINDYYFNNNENISNVKYRRRYSISDAFLTKIQELYGKKVNKEDIFYYIYAIFHSPQYIEKYGDNIVKEMPRIPTLDGFAEYVRIGKELADLHINYEKTVLSKDIGVTVNIDKQNYNVEKMRFHKQGNEVCKETIIYNDFITISGIPLKAYEYVVNGKSAIEWVMERYAVSIDKASGIVDNPNDYAGGEYVFNLLLSIINVSIKTQELINSLPEYKEI